MVVSRAVLRTISDYDGISEGLVASINFSENTITIDGNKFNIIVPRANVESVFEAVPEYKNVEASFRNLLKPYSSKLSDLNTILRALNIADNPLLVINSYLAKNKDNLQMDVQIVSTPSGDFEFIQPNPLQDAIAQKILSESNELKYSDLTIQVDSNDDVSKNFVVTVNGETYLTGTIAFNDGN